MVKNCFFTLQFWIKGVPTYVYKHNVLILYYFNRDTNL